MIKTVLFDVDGVLLSEERYFDASALTVWEILYSRNYLGLDAGKFKVDYSDSEIEEIRNLVFEHDLVLKFQKSCGLNANWDMIYLTVAYQLIRLLEQVKNLEEVEQWVSNEINRDVLLEIGKALAEKEINLDFAAFLEDFKDSERTKEGLFSHLEYLAKEKLGVQKTVFSEIGELWSTCEHVSQEWYVGDKHVLASTGRPSIQAGKKGFLSAEKVLAPAEEIASLFETLKTAGITIGIGTGRPELETIEPFQYLRWLKYFDVNNIVTADDVLTAERAFPEAAPLSKPNPFTYVKALSGKKMADQECIVEKMPIPNGKETLIVGDSFADLLAAQKMGCTFAAVLTGLSGKDARAEFEKHHAEYILDSVLDIKELVLSLVK